MFRSLMRCAALVVGLGTGPAVAGDAALILQTHDYSAMPDLSPPYSMRSVDNLLRDAGFELFVATDDTAEDMTETARRFAESLDEDTGRVFVFLSGHYVEALNGNWLLGRAADSPDSLGVSSQAVSVTALLDLISGFPGRAVLVAAEHDREFEPGMNTLAGLGHLRPPQGVTVAQAPTRQARDLVGAFLTPGRDTATIRAGLDEGARISGFVSEGIAFTPRTDQPDLSLSDPEREERAYFRVARDIGTVEALLAYVKRYPDGRFTTEANNLVRQLRDAPRQEAEAIEAALGLTRGERRRIQQNLSVLGYNTRGIDGIFGPGTRSAVSAWQRSRGIQDTGYLTRSQVAELERTAQRRRDQIAEEERQRKAEAEARERAYWQDTGALGTEAGLRAYLRRYPNGLYSDLAEAQLDSFEEARESEQERRARRAWRRTQRIDTIEAYQDFLDEHPDSKFSDEARDRISELGGAPVTRAEIERAREEERRRVANIVARMLVEQRLVSLGLDPGPPDGGFTEQTRDAIRAFQRARGILPTGYVDSDTLGALLP